MTTETLWELIQAYADATRWREGQEIDRLEGRIRQSLGELSEPDEAAREATRMTDAELRAFEQAFEGAVVAGGEYVSANTRGDEITLDAIFNIDKLVANLKTFFANPPAEAR